MIWQRLSLLCMWIVGTVLLIAAFSKMGDWKGFWHSLETIPLLPWWGAVFLSFWIPAFELTLGLCLLAGVHRHKATVLAFLLFSVFTIWLIFASFHPKTNTEKTGCGCMKISVAPQVAALSGWGAVGRNIGLMLLCAGALYRKKTDSK